MIVPYNQVVDPVFVDHRKVCRGARSMAVALILSIAQTTFPAYTLVKGVGGEEEVRPC